MWTASGFRRSDCLSRIACPMKTNFDPARWIARFDRNREARPVPRWEMPVDVPASARAALIRSVREFQLGDGGGPAALIAWNARRFRDSSPAMRNVVDLW